MLRNYANQPLFGEASTYYTIGDSSRRLKIPERIQSIQSEMKFIYIIRNPFDRIISNYLHAFREGYTKAGLNDYLDEPEGKVSVLTSMYQYQLDAYLEYFQSSQLCVLIFEEFLNDPVGSLNYIYDFLDINIMEPMLDYNEYKKVDYAREQNNHELKFNMDNFKILNDRILPDLERLSLFRGRQIDSWDISNDKWCLET